MSVTRVRIGTRRSQLATWQAEWVAAKLRGAHPGLEVEIVTVRTLGDKDRRTALHGMARQGVFTKEIEEALYDRRCDLAVHSMKDLPVRFPEGLCLGAVFEREDPRDALIARGGRTLRELPRGAHLGTSSLRRRSQLLRLRPDLVIGDLRGNVPGRIRSAGVPVEPGEAAPAEAPYDATVLAYAGLRRLGWARVVAQVLPTEAVLPAPAQGVVATELRADDEALRALLEPLNHLPTLRAVTAEREFLEALGGWCHVPVGALAEILDGPATATGGAPGGRTPGGRRPSAGEPLGEVHLRGFVGDPDGQEVVEDEIRGTDPHEVGRALAGRLEARGAKEILARVLAETGEDPCPS